MVVVSVCRSRLQYDGTQYPLVFDVDSSITVGELKRLIRNREKILSRPSYNTDVLLVMLKKDVILEDHRKLDEYGGGLSCLVEKNLFLKRQRGAAVVDILMVDTRHLTPSQKLRLSSSLHTDERGKEERHCIQQ